MAFVVCLLSCLLFGFSKGSPALYDGYVKCPDGSSPQKDDGGHTLACQAGQQSYTPCQASYQCSTPLPGRPGVCCKLGYVAATPGTQTYGPPPVTAPPLPPPETAAPPTPSETFPPPPPPETPAPPAPPMDTPAPPVNTPAPPVDTPAPPVDTPAPPPPSQETVAPPAPPAETDAPPTNSMGLTTGGIDLTPPPPTDFTDSTVNGGIGGQDTTTTTMVPAETTTNIDSIPVVTDSNGNVVVSPNSVAQNRKQGHKPGSAADVQKPSGHGRPNQKHSSPAPSTHLTNGSVAKSSNSTTPAVVIKIVTTSTLKPSPAPYPMKNGRPLANGARRFSSD